MRSICELKEELETIKLENEQFRQPMFGSMRAAEETEDYTAGMDGEGGEATIDDDFAMT